MADAEATRHADVVTTRAMRAETKPLTRTPDAGNDRGVSVILIVRNGERFIGEALDSVVAQTLLPSEILVIDGHSTDGTVEIAGRYQAVTVVTQTGTGIANAYNEGIARARYDLIAFISHDDRWMPSKLERQVAALMDAPDALLAFTHVQHVLADGATPPPGFRMSLLDGAVPGFIMETLVARRAAFDIVGLFDPSFAVGEDTDWFARARDAHVPTVVLPETLVVKRVHDSNSSLNYAGMNDLLLKALRQSIARKRNAGGAT
jgi:glycosyltransferase involved in cell wall biosynthesis